MSALLGQPLLQYVSLTPNPCAKNVHCTSRMRLGNSGVPPVKTQAAAVARLACMACQGLDSGKNVPAARLCVWLPFLRRAWLSSLVLAALVVARTPPPGHATLCTQHTRSPLRLPPHFAQPTRNCYARHGVDLNMTVRGGGGGHLEARVGMLGHTIMLRQRLRHFASWKSAEDDESRVKHELMQTFVAHHLPVRGFRCLRLFSISLPRLLGHCL